MNQIEQQGGTFFVSGDLSAKTVPALYSKGIKLFASVNSIALDLSKIKAANSTAVALILAWFRYAQKNNKNISLQQIPMRIKGIAHVCGLEPLFNQLNSTTKGDA